MANSVCYSQKNKAGSCSFHGTVIHRTYVIYVNCQAIILTKNMNILYDASNPNNVKIQEKKSDWVLSIVDGSIEECNM